MTYKKKQSTSQGIAQLREKVAQALSDKALFLEEVELKRAGKFTRLIFVVDLADGPGGVTDTQLAEATHIVSDLTDQIDPINGAYNLEVTTPGIERPLETSRHFRRAQGHDVELKIDDGQTLTGKLEAVTEEGIELIGPAGKQPIPFSKIDKAQMVIRF